MFNIICNVWNFQSMDDVKLFLRACELKWIEWQDTGKATEWMPHKYDIGIKIKLDWKITCTDDVDVDFRDKIKEMCPNYIVSTKDIMDIQWLADLSWYCNWESVRIENWKMHGSLHPWSYDKDKKSTHLFVTADEYNRIMKNGTQPNHVFWIWVTDLIREKEAMLKKSVDHWFSVSYPVWVTKSPYSTVASARECTATGTSSMWRWLIEDGCMSTQWNTMTYKKKSRLTFKKVL